jgi:hypothetical protein
VKVRHETARRSSPTPGACASVTASLRTTAHRRPGVDFLLDQVDGLPRPRDKVLHAWKAGPQTVSWPSSSARCRTAACSCSRCRRRLSLPARPYERICQVAWYLKTNKPKAKLIVLDANQNIVSKTALFRAAWQAYPNIEYRASNKA